MSLNKKIFCFFIVFILTSCAQNQINTKTGENTEKIYFNSKGFALIYEDSLYESGIINKKINNDELVAMHSFLKKNTPIKIVNPENSFFSDVKIYKKAKYPKIFNLVISKHLADILELDIENPYIEIREIKKNKTFVAKKANTFEEESKVAETAPVEKIEMNDLTSTVEIKKKENNKKNSFVLIISDFYFIESANNLKKELSTKTGIDNFKVVKIKKNQYRLSIGPFKNFNALKSIYISLNNLGFNDLNIINQNK